MLCYFRHYIWLCDLVNTFQAQRNAAVSLLISLSFLVFSLINFIG